MRMTIATRIMKGRVENAAHQIAPKVRTIARIGLIKGNLARRGYAKSEEN